MSNFNLTGITKLLDIEFDGGVINKTGSYTLTQVGTLTFPTTGGVDGLGHATGWQNTSNYLRVNELVTPATNTGKTYVAWYKGTQTASGAGYSPSVPIFAPNTNDTYYGLGINGGKISVNNGSPNVGSTSVNTGQWVFLAWVVKSNYQVNAFVNGVQELTNIAVNQTYPGTNLIGAGYPYGGVESPTALDKIMIFNAELTASQVLEVYQGTGPQPGFTAPSSVLSGNTIDITYIHTASSGTVAYTISGVTSGDINGNSLSGNMTVTNSSATLSIPTTIFSSGGAKTLTITAGAYSASVSIAPKLYVRSATGGTESLVTLGGILYKVHRFNSSANFTIFNADAGASANILIVAGGGSGGNHNTTNANGGGGGGGVLQGTTSTLSAGTYAVVVGGGGSAIANSTAGNGVKGTNSSLGSYVAEGGGGGGSTGVAFSSASQNGGSGGGNAYGQSGGGSANVNATAGSLSALGFNGGSTSATWTGAGGGGAGAAGVSGSGSSPGGNGGIGITNTWTGSTLYLAGGGGGGGNSSERAGDGFYGGGRGAGTTTYYSYNVYTNEVNATTKGSGIPTALVNSGGGGGGGSYWAANGGWTTGSGAGGSGIVIVFYEASPGFSAPSSVVSGNTIDITYIHSTSSGAVAYTITGVTSADLNGTSLTGNMTVTNSSATLSIPTAPKVATINTLTITAGAFTASVTITPGISARYLVVAGGGGGGSDMGGGGGAGGYLAGTGLSISGSNNIVIGAGGAGGPAGTTGPAGSNGQNTTALGLTAIGGGGGASDHDSASYNAGNGGSGGGGSGARQSSGSYGGLPGTGTSGQGNNGAASGVTWYPGGGGGAGAAASQTGSQQANGGIGLANDILGTSYYWAGGGAGAGYSVYGGNGGLGGGGGGAPRQSDGVTTNGQGGGSALNTGTVAEIGTTSAQTNKRGGAGGANTGGGGGGGSHYVTSNEGGAGGSGIVVIRYAGGQRAQGGTVTSTGSDTVHTFLTSGAFTVFSGGLTSSHTSAYWAETVTLTYADDLADGSTVAYTITGVTSEQISNASLTGNFTINSSLATLAINLATLSTATTATMVITAGAYSKTITITNIISFTSSVAGTYWGGSITFTTQTRGLTPGGLVPYTISGVTSAQISNTSLTGNITNVLAVAGYSASFNGTTSKLSIPSSADFAFGTGNFTIEFWIKTTDGAFEIVTQTTTGSPNWGLIVTGSILYWQNGFAASSLYSIALSSLTSNPTSGSWTHVAITRNGVGSGNLRFWINGVGQTAHTSADTTNYTGQGPIQISGPGNQYGFFVGNISNFRIVKGVAVYTGNFTVPTNPLTATQSSGTNISAITGSQTSLLCCQSATIIDNSVAVRTITNTAVTVSSDAPIGNTALADVGGGIASLILTTNPSEPILNTATMVTAITGTSITSTIRTGNPRIAQNFFPTIQSLIYVDSEIIDTHSQGLEAKVTTLTNITAQLEINKLSSTPGTMVYIDTEVTDVHAQALEATVNTLTNITVQLEINKLQSSLNGFVAAPTFAYSSGEDIKVSPTAIQTWYM